MKKWRIATPVAALAAVAVAAVMLVGTGAAAPTASSYKAGLVSDVGRFNDKGFNQNQLTGLKFAQKHIKGLEVSAVESRAASEYLPNFASLARKGYNIIIGAGFLLAADEAKVAKQFPNTKFAITDNDVTGAPFNGKQSPNVEGLTYATQENSYLAGCLAAMMVKKQGGDQTIGVVGGVKIPPVDSFLAGYQAGRRSATRASRCSRGTRRTSSTRPSARRSRRTRSTPARRSSSTSQARAASARSTRRRRPGSGASASTSTRATSASTS